LIDLHGFEDTSSEETFAISRILAKIGKVYSRKNIEEVIRKSYFPQNCFDFLYKSVIILQLKIRLFYMNSEYNGNQFL